jgi:hypothetical protein
MSSSFSRGVVLPTASVGVLADISEYPQRTHSTCRLRSLSPKLHRSVSLLHTQVLNCDHTQ